MDIYWLQQSEADLPATDDWLNESESARLSSFRFAKRRADWRLGRWTAKRAVAALLRLPDDSRSFKQIEISPAATGQPEVILHDHPDRVTISISHRGGFALCAVALGEAELGCDLEIIEPRSDAFIADYFTRDEQELIAHSAGNEQALLVSLLWSAKESALKALHVGLRAATLSVGVEIPDFHGHGCLESGGQNPNANLPSALLSIARIDWRSLQVQCSGGAKLHGWWQRSSNIARTIVSTFPAGLPIALRETTR